MKSPQSLSRFHGAVSTRMSPELLVWLTRYSPKNGETRKLRCSKVDGEPYFEESDLAAYDSYLKEPWPCKEGGRPNIPTGIEREIEVESYYSCAICGKSTRESAHIDPVYSSKNNHPHNLICLCPTHHTEYDTGVIPKGDISALKKRLISSRLTLWKLQAQGFDCAISAIADVGRTGGLPKEIHDLLTAETLEALGSAAASAPASEFSKKVSTAVKSREPVQSLREARNYELERLGDIDCPLCHGTGNHNGLECPICDGFGVVNKHAALEIDLSPFDQVDCPLCDGEGRHDGDDCPVCHGDCKMDRRFAENVDLRDFDQVDCPLCDGKGRHEGDDCPVCHGDCTMDRRFAENVDLRDFDQVDCPLCKGKGRHEGDDCPVCHGDGKMDRRFAENVDLRDFDQINCPLCDGKGRHEGDDCPVCHGDGKMDRRFAEAVDLNSFL